MKNSSIYQSITDHIKNWAQKRRARNYKRMEVPGPEQLGMELANIESVVACPSKGFNKASLITQIDYVITMSFPDTIMGDADGKPICTIRTTLRRGLKKNGQWFDTYAMGDTQIVVQRDKEDPYAMGIFTGIWLMTGFTYVNRDTGRDDMPHGTMVVRCFWSKEATRHQVAMKNRILQMVRERELENGLSYLDNATVEYIGRKPELQKHIPQEVQQYFQKENKKKGRGK